MELLLEWSLQRELALVEYLCFDLAQVRRFVAVLAQDLYRGPQFVSEPHSVLELQVEELELPAE